MAVTTAATNKRYGDTQQTTQATQATQKTAYQTQKQATANKTTQPSKVAAMPQMQVGGRTYNSRYGAALDNILSQIQNPQEFKYDFNGDELFKQYADLYAQKGKQASMDAIGQASALTGGYGNSYAEQVGNQAYDQYLLDLYDKGAQFRDAAYQQYMNNQNNLYNQYNALAQQENAEYDRWYNAATNEQAYAAEYAMQLLSRGQLPSDDLLAAAGMSKEDAQKMIAQAGGGGGGGGGGKKYYIDKYGYVYTNNNGKITYVDKNTLSDNTKVQMTNNGAGYDAYVAQASKNPVEKRANQKNVKGTERFIH